MKHKVLIFLVVFISSSGFSQQQFVGVGLQSEFKSYNKLSLAYGLSYENQLSKHHGFEVDLNYRSSMLYFNLNAPASGINNLDVAVRENFISLPVFYRFYSTIVNLSTGFTFDYFVSGNYLPNAQNQVFSDYYIDPKLYIGWIAKVGKSFSISPKLVLEPEVYVNPVFGYGYSYFGASVKLKYKL